MKQKSIYPSQNNSKYHLLLISILQTLIVFSSAFSINPIDHIIDFIFDRINIIFSQRYGRMGCGASSGVIEPKRQINRGKLKTVNNRRRISNVSNTIVEKVNILEQKISQKQIEFIIKVLENHSLFTGLPRKQLKIICEEMAYVSADGYIFKQGDSGGCFFVIESGELVVEIDQKQVKKLTTGETFGQLALLLKANRTASIKCLRKSFLFIMRPLLYKTTLQNMQVEQFSRNIRAIETVPLFGTLTNKQKHSLANRIKSQIFKKEQVIFREGEDALAIYIVAEGIVKISIGMKEDIFVKSGEIFGEGSLQEGMKRSGTAIAVGKVNCSVICRSDIEAVLGSSINDLVFYNTKKWTLMRSAMFANISSSDLNKFITAFETQTAKAGELDQKKYCGLIICLQGKINDRSEGILFNEQSWVNKSLKCESLVKNETGKIAFLNFQTVRQLFDELSQKKKKQNPKRTIAMHNNLQDYTYIKKLGQGQFGQVHLIRNKQYGDHLYAIKSLNKQSIKREEMMQSVEQERRILQKAIFPYIVGFVKGFQDKYNMFLLMEYIKGMEMFDIMREMGIMKNDVVRYYFGCLMSSVEYLHDKNIVYRDLKPQNSVVDHRGKVYLIDLGTAKQLKGDNFFKTFTIIGTPHYMAPQIFEGRGYSFQVDFWSLGILLYQFVCCRLPFGEDVSGDPFAIYSIIKKSKLQFPHHLKQDKGVKNLIEHLLVKDPKQRVNKITFEKMKHHLFFKGFSWKDLLNQKMNPPYIPKQYRSKTNKQVKQKQGKPFLEQFYQGEKYYPIEEWNCDQI